jgi:hypothetical protein
MSLSYFSSLNMLKGLRDMNADTTSAAVALSADAASAAAGAAAAANLPNMKHLKLGAGDFVESSIQKKIDEVARSESAALEIREVEKFNIPDNVRTWTCTDVGRWLDSLTLGQYRDGKYFFSFCMLVFVVFVVFVVFFCNRSVAIVFAIALLW